MVLTRSPWGDGSGSVRPQSAAAPCARPLSGIPCRPISAMAAADLSLTPQRTLYLYGPWADAVLQMRSRAEVARQRPCTAELLESERAERAKRQAAVEAERKEVNVRARSATARAERRLQEALQHSRQLDEMRFIEAEKRKQGLSRYWLRSSNLRHEVESVRPSACCREQLTFSDLAEEPPDEEETGWVAAAARVRAESRVLSTGRYSVDLEVEDLRNAVDYSVDESEHYGDLADGHRSFCWALKLAKKGRLYGLSQNLGAGS